MRNTPVLSLLALAAGLALTGCSGGSASTEAASSTTSASATATPSSTPSSSASASATPSAEAEPEVAQSQEPADQEAPPANAAADQQNQPAAPAAPEDAQIGSPPAGDQLSNPVEQPGQLSGPAPQFNFTYDEAYRAWQSGMPYYEAFCVHYQPTTQAGLSQCQGTVAGTVDYVTGAYIGP